MTTISIMGGGAAQSKTHKNSNLTPQISRFLVTTSLVLVAGQWVILPIAPHRNTPYTKAELVHLAAMSQDPIAHVQVTYL
ncbi:hypothetical protein [Deefgea salmonis]|uniref:Uncharacterized protein n=1 Tax=Deefgea salmonis TaxID=2875502 RepID=A0ABS8BMP5_9NEIS|nr:hypothetical protein [Deefgea salmonis]MCB5196859.1 hypothetical protein [Deefgea salmonis]